MGGATINTPTVVSVSLADNVTGDVRCIRIGHLVIVQITEFCANVARNGAALITGLPECNFSVSNEVFSLQSELASVAPLRVALYGTTLYTHFTLAGSLGTDPNSVGHSGYIIYFTNDDL